MSLAKSSILPASPRPSIWLDDRRDDTRTITYGADGSNARNAFARALEKYDGHSIYVGPGRYIFSAPIEITRPVDIHLSPDAHLVSVGKKSVGLFEVFSDGVSIRGGNISSERVPTTSQTLVLVNGAKDFSISGVTFRSDSPGASVGISPSSTNFLYLFEAVGPIVRECKFIPDYDVRSILSFNGNRHRIIANEFSGGGANGVGGEGERILRAASDIPVWLSGGETFVIADNLFFGLGEKHNDLEAGISGPFRTNRVLPEESIMLSVIRIDRAATPAGSEDGNGIISNNVIQWCAAEKGIHLVGTVNVTVADNVISNLDRAPTQFIDGGIVVDRKFVASNFPAQPCIGTTIRGNHIHAATDRDGDAAGISHYYGMDTSVEGGKITGLEQDSTFTSGSIGLRIFPTQSAGFSCRNLKFVASRWYSGDVAPVTDAPVYLESGSFSSPEGASGHVMDGSMLLGMTVLARGPGAASLVDTNTVFMG
jgi:hypothetical protein